METLFAEVILPLHLPKNYTYLVPREYHGTIAVGQRVVVQFGSKKLYSAIVRRLHNEVPEFKAKYILSILDIQPIVDEGQMRFWEWIAEYYMCYVGEVMAIALPAALRLASESTLSIHPDYSGEIGDLSEHELQIVQLLMEHPGMTPDDIARALGINKVMHIINTMVEREIVIMNEELRQRYVPRTATWLTLAPEYQNDDEACKALFDEMEKKASTQKQLHALMLFMQLTQFGAESVMKKVLLDKGAGAASVSTLVKKGVLLQEERVESRLTHYGADETIGTDTIMLNEEQQEAYSYIKESIYPAGDTVPGLKRPHATLLHGVTSSGKTEVYIKIIQEALDHGEQVLFLLPEIALTAQLINRLRRYFGDRVGVYHSRYSVSQRTEVWSRTKESDPTKRYDILVGARSALFLPFRRLGVIIVDEEHDSSFKQYEPAPRYHGRDAAIYLAHQKGAHVVLGSATPSIESYYNAKTGKYGLVTMTRRYGGVQMPEVLCADMRQAIRSKEVSGHFSTFLLNHIREALTSHEQVILFQNRRGFSLRIECDDCHNVPQCQHCDVSLVYHKATNSLRCHYCGYSIPVPTECPACHSTHLTMKGFGTERIEDDLSILFPEAHIARMDLDSTQQKDSHARIINDFQNRSIDILVGTQMVTKGLDFDNVSVVGILSADNLISYPDFRSFERAFQQMMQVSGRAGRHGHRGKVIIQAFNPWHQAIRNVIDNDYAAMYASQITERRVFRYPPYYRLINITLKHRDKALLDESADAMAGALRSVFGTRVMGPEYPSVPRIRGLYLKTIILRFERTEAIAEAKHIIRDIADKVQQEKNHSTLMISYDVDPQ